MFSKTILKNSSWEPFLKTIFNCFNSVWELKYEKQYFRLILHEGIIQLCMTQKFAKYSSSFQLLLRHPVKNKWKHLKFVLKLLVFRKKFDQKFAKCIF